jgi:hypothetical protein
MSGHAGGAVDVLTAVDGYSRISPYERVKPADAAVDVNSRQHVNADVGAFLERLQAGRVMLTAGIGASGGRAPRPSQLRRSEKAREAEKRC